MKMINYPSTPQFREVVTNINRTYNYIGIDEKGEAIYDALLPKPVITFKGSVKLHGTSAGVMFNDISGLWVQSRSNIITPQSDNAGFAFFVESRKESFINLVNQIKDRYNIDTNKNTICVYSEWAGSNIQKGVGITNIEKSCFIYGVKIAPIVENEDELKSNPAYWVDHSKLSDNENKIYNILDFKTYEVDIDFNCPELSQNKIVELTLEVEEECPVAKHFGFPNTIGEGIVFTHIYEGGVRVFFKSKGLKHSISKVNVIKKVDNEKIDKIIDIAQKVCPSWRLDQMLTETFNLINGGDLDRSKLGLYIKAVINDIIKEEIDTISDADLEIKDIAKYVSEIAKSFYFEKEKL